MPSKPVDHADRVRAGGDFLYDARREGRQVEALPEDVRPISVADRLAIQDAFVAASELAVVGWKLGGTTAVTSRDAVAAGLPYLLADNCAAGVLVLGPSIDGWRRKIDDVPVRLTLDSKRIAEGTTANVTGGALNALTAFVNRWTGLGRSLVSGCTVATGGCTPYTIVPANMPVTADFGPIGRVVLTFRGDQDKHAAPL